MDRLPFWINLKFFNDNPPPPGMISRLKNRDRVSIKFAKDVLIAAFGRVCPPAAHVNLLLLRGAPRARPPVSAAHLGEMKENGLEISFIFRDYPVSD